MSNSIKDFRFPIESGNLPENPMFASLSIRRGLLLWNSGRYPVRFSLSRTLRNWRFRNLKISMGNSPYSPQPLRPRDVKEDKLAKMWGTGEDMFTIPKWRSLRLVKFSATLFRRVFGVSMDWMRDQGKPSWRAQRFLVEFDHWRQKKRGRDVLSLRGTWCLGEFENNWSHYQRDWAFEGTQGGKGCC